MRFNICTNAYQIMSLRFARRFHTHNRHRQLPFTWLILLGCFISFALTTSARYYQHQLSWLSNIDCWWFDGTINVFFAEPSILWFFKTIRKSQPTRFSWMLFVWMLFFNVWLYWWCLLLMGTNDSSSYHCVKLTPSQPSTDFFSYTQQCKCRAYGFKLSHC